MSDINLNLKKSLFSPKLYPLLLDYSNRWEVYLGSAGSGKSYFITQKLIIRALKEPIKILVCRRYGTTIRNTCFALFKDILTKWQLIPFLKIRETDFNIKFPNGSEILFTGLDEETKLLSLTNIGCVFVEECFECGKEIVEQLNLRLRGQNSQQQIILAFNPISKHHWLYDFCEVSPPQSFYFSKTTYKDNPFLSEEYVASLEELYVRNPQKARIYCDGDWGVDPEGLVFQNWKTETADSSILASSGLEHRCGMDFGYRDPSAIVESFFDREKKIIYVVNEFYKTGCQLDELYEALKQLELTKSKIYCDSAEPRTIDFLKKNGVPAYSCIKGANSVESRIAFLQNNQIIIDPKCENVIREFENFAYEKNKDGEYTSKTTHEFSHSIDALGYAYSDIYTKGRMRTLDKSILGL